MTNREQEILNLIRENPYISQQELAERLGIQRSSVAVQISNLMKKGVILGKGYIIGEGEHVVVIGGSNMDLTGAPDSTLKLRDSNPGGITLSVGGVGRNIADNLARLGVHVKLITALSNDLYGKKITEENMSVGIDMSHAIASDDYGSAIYLSILDETGDMMVALVDSGINTLLTPAEIQRKRPIIQPSSAIVIDANLSEETIHYIAGNYSGHRLYADTVSATKAEKLKAVLPHLYCIKPNRLEAEILSGISIEDEASLNAAMDALLEKGVRQVFISMGEEGVFYGNSEKRGWAAPIPCQVVNATGAGDAFMAGVVYSDLEGYPIEKTVEVAQAMAYLALTSERTISAQVSALKVKTLVEEMVK